ncbi:hypothetical protein ACTFIW_000869 [Dictyostelium discoideum]
MIESLIKLHLKQKKAAAILKQIKEGFWKENFDQILSFGRCSSSRKHYERNRLLKDTSNLKKNASWLMTQQLMKCKDGGNSQTVRLQSSTVSRVTFMSTNGKLILTVGATITGAIEGNPSIHINLWIRERPLKKERVAIQPTRCEDYAEWYQQIIKASDIAENSPANKETGHSNAYFPLFVPVGFLKKKADHVEGFAKECAVVTHYRLETKDGRLMPAGELEEPLVVRPTSETVIGNAFSRWVNSWRDLPLKINQWANVVGWEMRPRIFLRTTDFLWQEGHTVHASVEDAKEETLLMLEEYRSLTEEFLALPVIVGEKSPGERWGEEGLKLFKIGY